MALQRQESWGAGEARPARGVLAGIDGLELQRPPRAGERLEAGAELLGRYGTMVKARVWLEREGQRIAEGELLLALTD